MPMNTSQLAEELAGTAMEKRANNTMQSIVEWLKTLSPAQRNALLGSAVGGVGAGAASAATGGNTIMDALLGAGLGAGAGYGGTRAFEHATGKDPIPSAGMGQNWDEVKESLPPGLVEHLVQSGLIGGGAAGAGFGLSKYVDSVNKGLHGFADARPASGAYEKLRTAFSKDPTAGKAREFMESFSNERMGQKAQAGLNSMNPFKRWSALRDINKNSPDEVFSEAKRMMKVKPKHIPVAQEVLGSGARGAEATIGRTGKSFANASAAGNASKFRRLGKWGLLPGALLGGYMALSGGGE